MDKRIAAAVAFVAFGTIAIAVTQTAPWYEEGVGGAETYDAIVQDLFTDHVIALEVLGVLLTAAMIGALVVARPLTGGADTANYPKADDEDLEKARGVSDVAATLGAPVPVSQLLPPAEDEEE